MALQAFMDDSGSEPQSPHFVLAGFVSPAKEWTDFTDRWNSVCNASPRIDYFKMAEAMGLRGEFGGWTREDRDEKVDTLSALIPRHASIQLCVHMRHDDFAATIKTLPIYNRQKELMYRHPYLLMWWILLAKFYPQWLRMGFGEPVDFIFDRQLGFEIDAVELWESMLQRASTRLSQSFYNVLGSQPRFADDKKEVPLQAADLHAWSIRRELSSSDFHVKAPEKTIENLNLVHPMTLNISLQYLQYIRARLQHQAGY